jgi:phosphoribosylamine---glycine ligase
VVFHAGTGIDDGRLVTSGGRVLAVTGVNDNLETAREKAYAALKIIHFEGMHFRIDIGLKALK